MTKPPTIGVLAARMQSDLDLLDKVATSYTDSIVEAGGIPVILPNLEAMLPHYLEMIDGLVIIGGTSDVDPSLYGQENQGSKDLDPEKDRLELKFIEQAIQRQIPIFGICRGLQTLNVYFGGSLIQDLPKDSINHLQYPSQSEHVHSVQIRGSHLVNEGAYGVNSVHHQAIDRVGEGLFVTAHAEDGVIEMIEHADLPIVGVQWHPECLPKDALSNALFEWLINKAR